MHELPVTQSLLKIAIEHAARVNARRIAALNIVVGELSSMVDESIQFYWEIIAKDTIAEGAVLRFRRVPAELQCMTCFEKYRPTDGELICPQCGSAAAKVIAGDEFFLETIDIEN